MKIFYTYIILLFLFTCTSSGDGIDFNKLEKRYRKNPADSIKLEAVHYFRREMPQQTSDMPIFRDVGTGRITTITLNSFNNTDSFFAFIKRRNVEPSSLIKNDINFIQTSFIHKEITTATSLWNKYPWNKHTPKEIFLNYLLPYKIHHEYPDSWRYHLKLKADSLISFWEEKIKESPSSSFLASSEEFYYDLIINTASQWFKYGEDAIRITEDPTYKELNLLREGGCKKEAFFNAYVLRSAGIPATVDIIPHWGSKNGTHAGDVYWNYKEKKMTPGPGR